MFRSVLKTALAAVALVGLASTNPSGSSATAAATISIEIFDGAGLIASLPATSGGFATLAGSDANFPSVLALASGVGLPSLPDPAGFVTPVDAQSASGNHTLTVLATQQGLTGIPGGTVPGGRLGSSFLAGYGTNAGNVASITISNFVDAGNGAFAMTTPIGSHTFTDGVDHTFSSFGPIVTPVSGLGTFSETSQVVINFTGATDVQTDSLILSSVPEPSTWAMMLIGFAGLGFAFQQSRRKVSFA
jgi:PEP-CTERM motif